ncbi:DnaA regulatory inactivator HdaA [Corticibacterium sp. UT-5YL-CI-8]|nr:DnaA regulatory inactivator HdaA [Tianweitania sp. UT-5YL-CI-8]
MPPRQLPLDLGHVVGLSRDDLVVSPANQRAAAVIDAWPNWPTPIVLLVGPAGSGKSHLAAIWREQAGAVQLPAHDIARHVGGLGSTSIIIDDIGADGLDETGLFHLINAVKGVASSLLLVARNVPASWNIALPDLASRVKTATLVEIHEPDDVLLSGVITKLFADRQVEVEPHVVQFLVRRIERSLPTAIRVVDRLDRLALEQKSKITRSMASEAIEAVDTGQIILDM